MQVPQAGIPSRQIACPGIACPGTPSGQLACPGIPCGQVDRLCEMARPSSKQSQFRQGLGRKNKQALLVVVLGNTTSSAWAMQPVMRSFFRVRFFQRWSAPRELLCRSSAFPWWPPWRLFAQRLWEHLLCHLRLTCFARGLMARIAKHTI